MKKFSLLYFQTCRRRLIISLKFLLINFEIRRFIIYAYLFYAPNFGRTIIKNNNIIEEYYDALKIIIRYFVFLF